MKRLIVSVGSIAQEHLESASKSLKAGIQIVERVSCLKVLLMEGLKILWTTLAAPGDVECVVYEKILVRIQKGSCSKKLKEGFKNIQTYCIFMATRAKTYCIFVQSIITPSSTFKNTRLSYICFAFCWWYGWLPSRTWSWQFPPLGPRYGSWELRDITGLRLCSFGYCR